MFRSAYSVLNILSHLQTVKGRKKMQKIVHLLEMVGLDLPFKYEYHHYGPYSAELQEEINYLVQHGFLSENNDDGTYLYEITEKGVRFKV